jgi:hypothetical protein
MATKSEETRISVPYIPFSTFTGFIEKLKNSAVPSMIDRSVLQNMSGSTRTQLMSALKAMKLVESNGMVKQELRDVVKSYNTAEWASVLSNAVTEAFLHVTSDVDLDSGTPQQLARAFKEKGNVDGQVLDKAVRFYLTALKESAITYSPHFDQRKTRKAPAAKKNPKKKGASAGVEDSGTNGEEDGEADLLFINQPGARLKFRLPIRGKGDAIISLPDDVTADDWAILKMQLDVFITPPKAKGGSHD